MPNSSTSIEELEAELVREIQNTPGEVEIYTVLAEAIVKRIMPVFHKALEAAEQRPVGDAITIYVKPEVMRFVLSKIKLKDATIARRVLVSEWGVNSWRENGGDAYIWQLKILASLTRRYNWAVFLLEPKNLPNTYKTAKNEEVTR